MEEVRIRHQDNSTKKILWLIVSLAVVVRVLVAVTSDNFNHPDENFQVLEQAHRVVFGYGIIPWEFRFTARSWIVPGLMAILLYPFKVLGLDNPNIYVPSIKILLSLFSIIIIISAYHIGKNILSPKAGLWAAFFCALWYESAYFSIRPLSEVWATTFFVAAYALSFSKHRTMHIVLAAFLVCLTAAIRINFIPAVFVLLSISLLRFRKGSVQRYILSIISGMILISFFDVITQGKPFISYINFYNIDKSFFMAGPLGSSFSSDYVRFLGYSSSYLYYLMVLASIPFWRKTGGIILTVFIVLLSHVLIPAKNHEIDYRHIYIVIPLILTIGGISVSAWIDKIRNVRLMKPLSVAIVVTFLLVSAGGAFALLPGQQKVYDGKIFGVYDKSLFYSSPRLQAYRYLYGQESLRGLYDTSDLWFRSGGFYYLHRDVPIYFSNTPPASASYISHIMTPAEMREVPGFELLKSFGNITIYARSNNAFQYRIDSSYTRDMYQPGVDDKFVP